MESVVKKFQIEGEVKEIKSFGDGLINRTFKVATDKEEYLLQRINHTIFENVDGLMNNIQLINDYLKTVVKDPERQTLTIIPTIDDELYYQDEEGNYWRVYLFMKNTLSFNQVETPEQFYTTGKAFGEFQRLLDGFDANQLVETIPMFHDTRHRYRQFEEAVEKDLAGRAHLVQEEIEFLRAKKDEASMLYDLLDKGELPLRVTHNDTKLNNVLFDKDTKEAICIVDLDTVMPGLMFFDQGDSIRFGANKVIEDEPDLSKVELDLELYEAYTKGFLEEVGSIMTDKEKELFVWGARIITLEQVYRFLWDYLNGDKYWVAQYPEHNLVRARNQLTFYKEIVKHFDKLETIVKKYI